MKNITRKRNYVDDSLTRRIIAACYEVHNKLGPGFVEKIYLGALKIALQKAEIKYIPEKEFWVRFDNEKVGEFWQREMRCQTSGRILIQSHGL